MTTKPYNTGGTHDDRLFRPRQFTDALLEGSDLHDSRLSRRSSRSWRSAFLEGADLLIEWCFGRWGVRLRIDLQQEEADERRRLELDAAAGRVR
jgi:broad specificity phosphatase PhoE